MRFRDYFEKLLPPWLLNYSGGRLMMGEVALIHDLLAEGATQAVKAHELRSDTSPNDALPSIGDERGLPRYAADTDDTYRERLAEGWEAWQHAGNDVAILGQYDAFGLTSVAIVTVLGGFAFEWPPNLADWSRFAIVIFPPHPWVAGPHTYDSGGIYDTSGWLYDTSMLAPELASIISIARKWKSAHERPVAIYLIVSGHMYDEPGLVYDTPGVVYNGGSVVIFPVV